jgi:type II secretory ATPase GspE/PulE/Tfp pilus assembly ATPase PilB-like protein
MLAIIAGLAIEVNASDLHIEPSDESVKLRYRIDGVLHDISELPKQAYPSLLSEVKIISGFATNIKVPTIDGRFVVFMDNKRYDCRVSIISSGFGETIVVRLLSADASRLELDKLGLATYTKKKIDEATKKTKGIIVTTGPTGSGKTTTLYSLINKLNRPDVKIITVEDPIEYQMDGVMQTQINKNQGYTFSVAMRSLLRQNPNILMIGEIRDEETANIAIEAAMTGHLVLSTIHANSAASAISRFVGLGMSRDMIANAIEYSIGQRLARRICSHCKQEYIPEPDVLAEVKKMLEPIKNNPEVKVPEKLTFYHGVGCEHCSNLGYKGRIGLYEVIAMIPQIQTMIKNNPSATDLEIEKVAVENGTITIMQDGILKALEGLTSLEEVFRVAK